MSTADLEGTSMQHGSSGLGWFAMMKDLLSFAGSRRTETVTQESETHDNRADEDGREGEVPEAVHPMLLVHYASPMF